MTLHVESRIYGEEPQGNRAVERDVAVEVGQKSYGRQWRTCLRRVFAKGRSIAATAEMGISPESLAENLALDTDVALSIGTAATHLFTDHAEELRGDIPSWTKF